MKTAPKGQIWKASYHQFRALANVVQRLRPDKTAPSIPKNLRSKMVRNTLQLEWDRATDNQLLLGYNLYLNRKRIGFTPLTRFTLTTPVKIKGGKFTIKAVDYQGNQSAFSQAETL